MRPTLSMIVVIATTLLLLAIPSLSGLEWSGPDSLNTGNTSQPFERPDSTRANIIISSDTSWTLANSPYDLTGNVLIQNGATLTIKPGVTVRFGDGNYIQVEGRLVANGTKDNRITFTSSQPSPEPGDWESILFKQNAAPNSIVRYCNFTYGYYGIHADDNNPSYTFPNVTYCDFQEMERGAITYAPRNVDWPSYQPSNIIENNTISMTGGDFAVDLNLYRVNVRFANNIIKDDYSFLIRYNDCQPNGFMNGNGL